MIKQYLDRREIEDMCAAVRIKERMWNKAFYGDDICSMPVDCFVDYEKLDAISRCLKVAKRVSMRGSTGCPTTYDLTVYGVRFFSPNPEYMK